MADRTPVVLALLAHALQARAADRPDDHDLHALADGVALAVDHGAVAALHPPTQRDHNVATWLAKILHFDVRDVNDLTAGDDVRAKEVSVARRLADVAASLRVRGEGLRREAEALWSAASRLLGLQDEAREQVDRDRLQVHVDLATAMAQRDPQMTYIATDRGVVVEAKVEPFVEAALSADLTSVTEQRDLLKRQLDELRTETRKPVDYGTGILFNPPQHEPNADCRDSYRGTALRAGAKDCALFIGPKRTDLTFVVEMREGAKVFDVVAALEYEHGLSPESYRIREVRTPAP